MYDYDNYYYDVLLCHLLLVFMTMTIITKAWSILDITVHKKEARAGKDKEGIHNVNYTAF